MLTQPNVRRPAGAAEAVAAAVIEFLTGALITEPRRVGKPLRGDLAGIHAARRGVVLRIDPRRDAYRPR